MYIYVHVHTDDVRVAC